MYEMSFLLNFFGNVYQDDYPSGELISSFGQG